VGIVYRIYSKKNGENVFELDDEGNINCYDIQIGIPAANIPANCSYLLKDSNGDAVMGIDHYGTIYIRDQAHTSVQMPVIDSISPAYGGTTGGDAIVITGDNFAADATVTIDGNSCTSIVVTGTSQIACDTPAGTAGAKDIRITNPNQGWIEIDSAFTYRAAPTVTACSPSAGNSGDTLTLTGTGFFSDEDDNVPTVTINSVSCTNVVYRNATSLQCRAPANSNGTYDVVVTNPDSRTGTLTNGFTYATAPTVTSVTPFFGLTAGGEAVTITGTGFVATPTVTFDGKSATSVTFVNSTTLTCNTPAHANNSLVDVKVTNPSTISGTGYSLFEYVKQETKTLTDAAGVDAATFEFLGGQIVLLVTSLGELKTPGQVRVGFD